MNKLLSSNLFLVPCIPFTGAFIAPLIHLLPITSQTTLQAYHLNSAYEWLSEERYKDPGYERIQWLDLDLKTSVDEEDTEIVLPLYPLGAVYLPSTKTNHTLINVEPQNLQMANDVMSMEDGKAQFCAVLRATDTGRVAHIGTILQILEADHQYVDGELVRIKLTCQAQANAARIGHILNPEAFGRERRLRKSSEYLKASVRVLRGDEEGCYDDAKADLQQEIVTLINNFNMIKTIYQLEIGSKEYPPSMLFQLGNAMTIWSDETFRSEEVFWEACQEWQSVCYTLLQGSQAMLSTNRNELMIASVKGPLNLPIHLEDLEPAVRRQVQQMEIEAQQKFLQTRLDPCLDFQALMSLSSYRERIQWLVNRVALERKRLETVATESSKAKRRLY